MTRLTAKDFPQELLELYDFYAHGRITKREFLDRAAKFAVGGVTAATLLSTLSPDYALAQQVSFTDPDIVAEYITYPSPKGNGEVRGYLVRPAKTTGKVAGVVVVHENRGLNPYIEDVARRVAKAGFIALAPDGLTSQGGYPGNDEKGRELQQKVDPTKLMNDFFAAIEFLHAERHDIRQGGHHRLLLWRRRIQCSRRRLSRARRGRSFLWSSAESGRRSAHQGSAAAALWRAGHQREPRMASIRGRAQGCGQDL